VSIDATVVWKKGLSFTGQAIHEQLHTPPGGGPEGGRGQRRVAPTGAAEREAVERPIGAEPNSMLMVYESRVMPLKLHRR
jgi:hypothetical protein